MSVATTCFGSAREFGEALQHDLQGAREAQIAVAFAKQSALNAVELERWCSSGRRLRLLAGTDFMLTELAVLSRLARHAHHPTDLRIYNSPQGEGAVFHPKLYLLDKKESQVAYVGSSNLTGGGLLKNVEANVRIEGDLRSPEIGRAVRLFHDWFDSPWATPVTPEFEVQYDEIQRRKREAETRYTDVAAWKALQDARFALVAETRASTTAKGFLLVVTPENYEICMQHRTWGRQREQEARAYNPGDLFFFHVRGDSRIRALGMFVEGAHFDDRPLWPASERGAFPWRIRFAILGELRAGLPTKEILLRTRSGTPAHWFNGYIQQSHSLAPDDFQALHREFQNQLTRLRDIERHGEDDLW